MVAVQAGDVAHKYPGGGRARSSRKSSGRTGWCGLSPVNGMVSRLLDDGHFSADRGWTAGHPAVSDMAQVPQARAPAGRTYSKVEVP